jgi:hypothetical protein
MPGGVCQVLDYEVEQMAEYVAEMATRIVLPQKNVNSAFRKFVSQILASTRLPSATILLGMNYLAKRINMMHAAGLTNHAEGEVWRLLTVALLLGSKFLDDNTFQNKSWSEVSGIAVQDLNTLEYEWLGSINWCLFVNLEESKDYQAWLDNWKEWGMTKQRQQEQQQATRERLAALTTPIDTDVARQRKMPAIYSSWHQQQVAEYERLSNMKHNHGASAMSYRRDQAWAYPAPSWPSAPLTPPDSGYGTPDYPNSAASSNSNYNEWFDRALGSASTMQRPYQPPMQYGGFHRNSRMNRTQPTYASFYPYNHNIWEPPNTADCGGCVGCSGGFHKHPAYFMPSNYGQPVMG